MLERERVEAVAIATPLATHADLAVGCLEAGRHVLCEKMMAWDVDGCRRMQAAAAKAGRVLEIGYQRFYNPLYQAAYEGVVKPGLLGDVYHARLVWHRNANWRRQEAPPVPDYDPSPWGYPTWDHLLNWRLYWRYSKGLLAELGSHMINNTGWFFGDAHPEAVLGSGGVYRFPEGREVPDHVYATFEYPGGRTVVFTSIESNAWDDYYELYLGTKGTLLLRAEREALLFEEGREARTGIEITGRHGAMARASGSRRSDSAGRAAGAPVAQGSEVSPYQLELSGFAAAVRTGAALKGGPDRAARSAQACILANEAIQSRGRIEVPASLG